MNMDGMHQQQQEQQQQQHRQLLPTLGDTSSDLRRRVVPFEGTRGVRLSFNSWIKRTLCQQVSIANIYVVCWPLSVPYLDMCLCALFVSWFCAAKRARTAEIQQVYFCARSFFLFFFLVKNTRHVLPALWK